MEGANSTVARRISGCYVAGPIDVNGVAVTKGAMISKISVANDSSANTGIYNCYWDSDILGTSMTQPLRVQRKDNSRTETDSYHCKPK